MESKRSRTGVDHTLHVVHRHYKRRPQRVTFDKERRWKCAKRKWGSLMCSVHPSRQTHTHTHPPSPNAGWQGKVPAPEQMLRAVCERRVTPALLRHSTFSLVHGPHVQCPAELQLPPPPPSWPRGGLAVFQASHLRLLRHLGSSHRPETRSHFSLTHIICMHEVSSFI